MKDDKTITDNELHAYVDQQLDDHSQRREIEAKLNSDSDAREKLDDYNLINKTLHDMYDPILDEDIPEHLLPPEPQSSGIGSRIRSLAASGLIFIFGSLFGWQSQVLLVSNDTPDISTSTHANLVQPAVFAHSVYAVEVAHPVEIGADQHQHLNKWLSKRLKTTLTAPNLMQSGYHLIGGRLLPSTEDRMAAQYMYEDNGGKRISLYVRRGDWQQKSQSINYSEQDGYSMFYWIDDDLGYALTSPQDKNTHQALAKEIYKQMSINSVKI